MVNISLSLDYLHSLIACYHIINAPTDLNKRFNPNIFEKLRDTTPEEKKVYLDFLSSLGYDLSNTDKIRTRLFFPQYSDLEKFLVSEACSTVPENMRKSLRDFDKKFVEYWKNIEPKMSALLDKRKEFAEKNFKKIYDLSEKLTGEKVGMPEELDIKIVEGLSPSSFGREFGKKEYIICQAKHFFDENDFGGTLIHESTPHRIASEYHHLYKEVLGRYIYEVEEGFVKLFSKKIAERLIENYIDYGPGRGLEVSFYIYEKNWDKLEPGKFKEWYKRCLHEVKEMDEFKRFQQKQQSF